MEQRTPDGYKRYQYIYEMERLYLQRPFSDKEMGDRLGTDRTNIYRIRKIMEEFMGIPITEHPTERSKYYIPSDYSITHIPLSREQAAALYLAARRLQQQTRTSQIHVADTLQKLSFALRKPLAEQMVRAAQVVMDQEQDIQQEAVFSTLVNAWLNRIPVRITHRVLHGEPRNYRVLPYLLEPSIWSDAVYLIGHSEYHGKLATFKTARIERAVLGTGQFEIPEDFDIHELLRHAWGVWHADEEPATVRLHFSQQVAPRVMETIWHPQQTITCQDDGSLIWQAPVAEWREMLPWVRGWGAGAEIMEPEEMRDVMVLEASRLATLYDVGTKLPTHMLFWAKTNKEGQTHPLICHLIDVGQVALILWKEVLTDSFRSQISEALGLSSDEAGRLLAFWAACHDLGKASPNFQRKYPPARSELETVGFTFPPLLGKTPCYHATITALILPDLLQELLGLQDVIGDDVAQALGGHHGVWPTDQVRRQHRSQVGDNNWHSAQRALVEELIEIFEPPRITYLGRNEIERGTQLVLLSGLTSVADWIGSMSEFFQFSTPYMVPAKYAKTAAREARQALKALGWLDWQPPENLLTFEQLHDFTPRPAQNEVINAYPGDDEPTMLIAEIATGTGKTELGLYLADRWAVLRQQRGLYVAMPTQATSNQMHGRVANYLRNRYPEQQINFHLIHSGARWRADQSELGFKTESEEPRGTIKAQGWFLPRKRTLLAPFAVGTTDQALMSTLQTRHFFVRLFGLSGKTIIFDEVHAYDTYMDTLFERLLVWLHAVGASVIVLSATLPAAKRRALITAWRGSDNGIEALDPNAYPSITVASDNALYAKLLPRGDSRTIDIEWIDHCEGAIIEALRERLVNDGCAAIICNRVDRAQAIYRAIHKAELVAHEDLFLFHARTPDIWRNATEKAVLDRFGKDSAQRPRRSIVVATQVIEQSLDLDFDLMISDLAPIDLLLQRAGRLHRHERDRPSRLETPTLLVTRPEVDDENAPNFGGDSYVYEAYVLLRSLWTLQANNSGLTLPKQTVELIEAVYGDEDRLPNTVPENAPVLLAKAKAKMTANQDKARFEARKRLVAMPDHEDLLWLSNDALEEDDPEVHASLQALTRLMRPTIDLVCLHGEPNADVVALDADGLVKIDLTQEPSTDLTKAIAARVVTVSNPAVRRHFVNQDCPRGWRNHSLLNTHRKAIFTNGVCEMEGTNYLLRLSQDLGLEIIRLDDAGNKQ